MKNKRDKEPTLQEIVEGVDIIGTMLDQELPQIREELTVIKSTLFKQAESAGTEMRSGAIGDILVALGELKEMLEQQEQRLLKLDARLAQLETDFTPDDGGSIGEVH